jgi:hypothetical protein
MKRHVDILVTQWALDSYLELKHTKQFSSADYERTIRTCDYFGSFRSHQNLPVTNSGLQPLLTVTRCRAVSR